MIKNIFQILSVFHGSHKKIRRHNISREHASANLLVYMLRLDNRRKTQLCKNYEARGWCPYGSNCTVCNHSPQSFPLNHIFFYTPVSNFLKRSVGSSSSPTESANSFQKRSLRTTKPSLVEDIGSTGIANTVTSACLCTVENQPRTKTRCQPTQNISCVQQLWTILQTWFTTYCKWNYDKGKKNHNLIPLLTPVSSFDDMKIIIE